jgi:hypothetical protein
MNANKMMNKIILKDFILMDDASVFKNHPLELVNFLELVLVLKDLKKILLIWNVNLIQISSVLDSLYSITKIKKI